MRKVILAFGDSITYGLLDPEGGWVARLRRMLSNLDLERPPYVYNLGIPGQTSTEILERIEHEIVPRVKNRESFIILGFGGNDTTYIISEKRNRVSYDEFLKNVAKIIEICRNYAEKILFIVPPLVNEKMTNPLPRKPDLAVLNRFRTKYFDGLKNLLKNKGVPFLEITKIFEKHGKSATDLLVDGIHPDGRGHNLIALEVFDFLRRNFL